MSLQGDADTGVSSATWVLPKGFVDSMYEIAIVTTCDVSTSVSAPGVDQFISDPVQGKPSRR